MTHYKMSDVAVEVNDRENNPASSKYDRFVGLEHYVSGEVIIRNYGSTENLESTMKIFQSGDVLVARRNVYLKRASMVDFDGLTSGDSIVLRAKNPVIGRILPFVLNTDAFWDFADQYSDGTMSKRLSPKTLMTYEFDLPDEEELEKFADLLWAANDTRESYQALLRQTDELVKSQFIELFGDPILNEKGWPSKSIKESAVRLSDGPFGSNLKSDHYSETGVRVIRLQNICEGYFLDDDKAYVSLEHYEKIKKYTCKSGEIIIGTLGEPNLRACIIPEYIGYAINKADCVHYIPNPEYLDTAFVVGFLNSPIVLNYALGDAHGNTRQRISSGQISKMPIIIPPMELQKQYAVIIQQTDKSKFVAFQETIFIEKILKYAYNHTFRRKNNVH